MRLALAANCYDNHTSAQLVIFTHTAKVQPHNNC